MWMNLTQPRADTFSLQKWLDLSNSEMASQNFKKDFQLLQNKKVFTISHWIRLKGNILEAFQAFNCTEATISNLFNDSLSLSLYGWTCNRSILVRAYIRHFESHRQHGCYRCRLAVMILSTKGMPIFIWNWSSISFCSEGLHPEEPQAIVGLPRTICSTTQNHENRWQELLKFCEYFKWRSICIP